MSKGVRFLAADLGASSGRIMSCTWDGSRFSLEELYRFANGPVSVAGELCSDVLGIWKHISNGIAVFHSRSNETPHGIGVDAWGVDFALLDNRGRLVANPLHYRDPGTRGIPEKLFARVSEDEWFSETGTQAMEINTLFQLWKMVQSDDPRLKIAHRFVTIPDLFIYFLSGEGGAEFTEATTTQMYSLRDHQWAASLLKRTGIPTTILPPVISTGKVVGEVRPSVIAECGMTHSFPAIAVASHDTAAAVACIPEMDESSVFISCGTWSLVGTESATPYFTEQARCLGFTNEGAADGRILILKNLNGLWLLQESIRAWKLRGEDLDWETLSQAATMAREFQFYLDLDDPRLHDQSDVLVALGSYLRATGQPLPDSNAEVARSALESLALKYRSAIESLKAITSRRFTTIRIVGGGCLNRLLCQMTADATSLTVFAGPVEASALGNGMIQAIATGHLSDLSSGRAAMSTSTERVIYHPKRKERWDEAFARFTELQVHGQLAAK